MKKSSNTHEEIHSVSGRKLLETVSSILEEGNVRKITIKDKKGKVIVQFPLTIGVIGTALVPVLAAVGALSALITECSITIERKK